MRPTTRLAAGSLMLALPLAAAAGCGVEKKRTIKSEFSTAGSNLQSSKAASFTLRIDDSKGKLAALAKSGEHDSGADAAIDDAFAGSITMTLDPTGAQTLADLGSAQRCDASKPKADLTAELKKINISIVVSDQKKALGEVRLVDGTLYAHVDLDEIGVVAQDGGVKNFDKKVDDAVSSADPKYAQALTDARAGKWLTLPLAKYADKFQDLAKSFSSQFGAKNGTTPATTCTDSKALSNDLFAAVKPYVKVTDANDSSSDRVLDVNVQARPALKAALAVVKAAKSLPFAALLAAAKPSDIDENVADGTAHGTIELSNGHLKQVSVDLESLRTLSPHAGKATVAGSSVVLDINDKADGLSAPTNVSSFDVGALLDDLLNGMGTGMDNRLSGSSSGSGSATAVPSPPTLGG